MKLNHHPRKCPLGKRDKKAAEGVVGGVVEVVEEEVVGVDEVAGEVEVEVAGEGEGEEDGEVVVGEVGVEEVSKAGETMVGGVIMVGEGAMGEEGAMVGEAMEIHMEEGVEVGTEDTKKCKK
jgi:hypothetical protein